MKTEFSMDHSVSAVKQWGPYIEHLRHRPKLSLIPKREAVLWPTPQLKWLTCRKSRQISQAAKLEVTSFCPSVTPKSKNDLGTPSKTKDMHHFAPSDSSLFRTILFCLLVMAMFGFFFSGNLIHVNMGKKIFLSSLSYLFTLQPAVLTYIFTF